MRWVLNFVYLVVLGVSLPWQLYRAIFQGKSRRGWSQKLFGTIPKSDAPTIWVHAVSVGEVILIHDFVSQLQPLLPNQKFVCSTSTETGYDLACQRFGPHSVFFFPWDFSWAIQRVLQRIQPKLILLAELEIWPNLIDLASQNKVPLAIINGRLSEKSFHNYQKFFPRFWQSSFSKIDLVTCQNEEYANRFRKLNAPHVAITGNLKFDGTATDRNHPRTTELKSSLCWEPENAFIWVAGSTQPEEDEIIVRIHQKLAVEFPHLKLIIVPRHLQNVSRLMERLQGQGSGFELRSKLRNEHSAESRTLNSDILIVDVIGELKYWWGIANAAYVGGSMGRRGGQNMMEPAGFGVPVSFGPNTSNFRNVVEQLLNASAAVQVNDEIELQDFIRRCLNDTTWAHEIGDRARQIVIRNQGATERTMNELSKLLPQNT